MKFKIALFLLLISGTLLMAGCNSNEDTNINESSQPEVVQNTLPAGTVIIPSEGEFSGSISWNNKVEDYDHELWLITNEGMVPIGVEETTKFSNIPEERIDERQKELMNEAKVDYMWFGLMSDLSEYLVQGDQVTVKGSRYHVDGKYFVAKEIYLAR